MIAAERSEKLRTEKFSSIAGIGNFRNCFNNAIRKSQMGRSGLRRESGGGRRKWVPIKDAFKPVALHMQK